MRNRRSRDDGSKDLARVKVAGALRRAGRVIEWTLLLGVLLAVGTPSEPDPLAPVSAPEMALPPVDSVPVASAEKSVIGTVVDGGVEARAEPSEDAEVVAEFGPINPQGAPQVFLLEREVEGTGPGGPWFEALLPLRPNGTTGFIRAAELRVTYTSYHIEVDTSAYELELYEGEDLVETFPVGIGTGSTPTPIGRFYLVSLLRPPDDDSVYGKYAYGLSAYSEVITDWEGGGVVGLHGTNDPSSVGRAVSAGCIRMRNRDIQSLVPILPLGTPVEIT